MTKTVKQQIYFDYAATTPIDSDVLRQMMPYLKENYGNPSSVHSLGQKAVIAIDKAREQIAQFLNCLSEEIIFTSSATEANNLAIKGVVESFKSQFSGSKPHIITSQIEHHTVLESCCQAEKRGAEVTYLPINKEGLISALDAKKAIKSQTILVSIVYANNEIGTVQPIAEIGNIIYKLRNSKSQALNSKQYPIFHTDAVQAVNYLDCDVKKLNVDLLTISGHKIYGPKGIGALFIKKGTLIEPQILGGGQEFNFRSGTENVAGIVGLGAAIKKAQTLKLKNKNLEELRDKLIDRILATIPGSQLNGSRKKRLPNNINISFKDVEGEAIAINLDYEGIAVSTGSACSSKSLKSSHVLLALDPSHKRAHGSLRFSLGKNTTKKEIDRILNILPKIIKRLREISGSNLK